MVEPCTGLTLGTIHHGQASGLVASPEYKDVVLPVVSAVTGWRGPLRGMLRLRFGVLFVWTVLAVHIVVFVFIYALTVVSNPDWMTRILAIMLGQVWVYRVLATSVEHVVVVILSQALVNAMKNRLIK